MTQIKNKNERGFTLLELMIVIAIIGLLASVVLIAINTARVKSRDTKRLADVHQLTTALELYNNANFGYPVQATAAKTIPGIVGVYVSSVPTAPLPADSSICQASTTGGINNDYLYTSADGSTYTLTFCLGGSVGTMPSGTHVASPAGIN